MNKHIQEFREFLLKQNAFALAIGVIIGAAIGKVISGIVDDLLMPLIGVIMPGGDWRNAQFVLSGTNAIKYGDLIGRIVDFVIVAAVVYAITKRFLEKKPVDQAPTTKTCPECLETIPLGARRCRACTAAIPMVTAA
jgi:large conductance mechanosensitive channel